MSSIFCCGNTQGYKNRTLSHEQKFKAFMSWASFPKDSSIDTSELPSSAIFAVQVVQQTNYGPLDSKRYFVATDAENRFAEVTEQWLIDANFERLNTFKNYKCATHNKFFEFNIYQKDPMNAHHWRANIVRPASEFDM